jgi:Cu2+-containing amine oxidase
MKILVVEELLIQEVVVKKNRYMKHLIGFNESSLSNNDIKGLKEIKDTLSYVLRDKYDNDNNVVEEQIDWIEKLIKRLQTNEN